MSRHRIGPVTCSALAGALLMLGASADVLGQDTGQDISAAPATPPAAPALQTFDLRNGSALRGRLVRKDHGKFVTIETDDGWEVAIPWASLGAPDTASQRSAAPARAPAGDEDAAPDEPHATSNPARAWGWGLLITGYVANIAGVMVACEESGAHCEETGQRSKMLVPVVGGYWAYSSTTNFSNDDQQLALALTLAATTLQVTGLGLIIFGKSKPAKEQPADQSSAPEPNAGHVQLQLSGLRGGGYAGLVGAF